MKKDISLLLTLFLCVATLSAQQVDTITIHSKMGHDLKNVIILPESYTDRKSTRLNSSHPSSSRMPSSA